MQNLRVKESTSRRALIVGGTSSLAVVPLSREDAEQFSEEAIHAHEVSGALRVNITILDKAGQTTKINQQAQPLTPAHWSGIVDATVSLARSHGSPWILLAGTIPLSTEESPLELAPLFDAAHLHGIHVGLDTSGAPLLDMARRGLPDVIKPNAPELAECVGQTSPQDTGRRHRCRNRSPPVGCGHCARVSGT